MLLLLLLMGIGDQGQGPSRPEPIDIISWFSPSAYPAQALRDSAQGSVRYRVEVGADGQPGACRIVQSSGNAALDEGTCEIVRRDGRFRPATDASGRFIASAFEFAVSWRMPAPLTAYFAAIVQWPAQGGNPTCRMEAHGLQRSESEVCAQTLSNAPLLRQLRGNYRQVTFVTAFSDGDRPFAAPSPTWGMRIGRLTSEQSYVGGMPYPYACRTVAAEGLIAERDACAGFPTSAAPPQAGDRVRRRSVETSLFGVSRN